MIWEQHNFLDTVGISAQENLNFAHVQSGNLDLANLY